MKTIQEICKEQINKFRDFMVETISTEFREKGEVEPSVYALVMQKNGESTVAVLQNISPLFTTEQGKKVAADIIRESAKDIKPIALAFASEAWIARVSSEVLFDEQGKPKKDIPTVREMDDKVEGLFVNIETFEEEYLKMWKVSLENGKRVLSDESNPSGWTPKEKRFPTVFGDLLTENYSEMVKLLQTTLKVNPN